MSRTARHVLAALILFGLPAAAQAADRPADAIVKEIDAVPEPTTREEFLAGLSKKAALIEELAKAYPDDERLRKLLPQRWMALAIGEKLDESVREINAALATTKDKALRIEANFLKAQILTAPMKPDPAEALVAAEAFVALAPNDRRAAQLLYLVATKTTDKAKAAAIEDRLIKEYPKTPFPEMIAVLRRQREAIGKPFDLEFTDAIKGSVVSIKGLKGKVVVVDFWATWCGPCVAEMPKMKKLYAEYKPKGVEFIGVSLDQPKAEGGLDSLKQFVAKEEITWPQYYQGNFWNSEFSKGWGVNSIPCVFIVDAEGNLYSTDARGNLDSLIPELLKKAKGSTNAGG